MCKPTRSFKAFRSGAYLTNNTSWGHGRICSISGSVTTDLCCLVRTIVLGFFFPPTFVWWFCLLGAFDENRSDDHLGNNTPHILSCASETNVESECVHQNTTGSISVQVCYLYISNTYNFQELPSPSLLASTEPFLTEKMGPGKLR